jgi:drug/metabolite transporter (DMT)-like permease
MASAGIPAKAVALEAMAPESESRQHLPSFLTVAGTGSILAGAAAVARTRSTQLACLASTESAVARSSDNSKWLPTALLFLFAMLCSTNFTTIKLLQAEHSEPAVAAVRFLCATLPFLPMIAKHSSKQSIKGGMEIGLWCFFAYLSQAIGLQQTEAAHGAFICSLAMVVPPLVKTVTGGEVKSQIWLAVLSAISGTALLIGLGSASGPCLGDFICSGTALGFGLMFLRMDTYAEQKGFDALGCTIWQLLTLAVCMVAWLLVESGPQGATQEVFDLFTAGPDVLALLAWISIVCTAGVLYVETWAMQQIDGAEAGIIFASEPVWATLFASVVLGEQMGSSEAMGGLLILAACLLTQLDFDAAAQDKFASSTRKLSRLFKSLGLTGIRFTRLVFSNA